MKKLLTADEVADRLSVDRSTVFRWASSHTDRYPQLPCYRIGRVVRFDPDELEDWLSGQRVGTPPRPMRQVPARDSRVTRLHTAVSRKVVAGMMAAQE